MLLQARARGQVQEVLLQARARGQVQEVLLQARACGQVLSEHPEVMHVVRQAEV